MIGYQPFLNIISCCLRHCIHGARGRWGCVLKFLLSIFTWGRGTAKFPWAPTCHPPYHWIVMLYKHVPCLDCCWPRPDCRKGPSVPGREVIKGVERVLTSKLVSTRRRESEGVVPWTLHISDTGTFLVSHFDLVCIWGGVAKCVWTG